MESEVECKLQCQWISNDIALNTMVIHWYQFSKSVHSCLIHQQTQNPIIGGSALDAVTAAVMALEDDPAFDAGNVNIFLNVVMPREADIV